MPDEVVSPAFGLRVRVLREQRQLTIEQLAEKAQVDPAHLGMIERGQRDARLSTILKIAAGLGVSAGDLFKESR